MQLVIFLIILLFATPSWAAIAFDAKANSTEQTAVSSITLSMTVGQINNGLLAVASQVRNSANSTFTHISGITYNGVALTMAKQQDGPAASRYETAEIWYLVSPAWGTHNIIVTYSASVGIAVVGAVSLSGVSQTSPLDATAGLGSTPVSSPWTVDITTVNNNSWLVNSSYTSDDNDVSVNNGETSGWDVNTNGAPGDRAVASYKGPITPAGATTTGWQDASYGGSDDVAMAVASFTPAIPVNTYKNCSLKNGKF